MIPHGQDGHPEHVASRFAGVSLMTGTLAWTLTFANIGSSIIPFAVSLSTSIACLAIVCRQKLDMTMLLTLLSGCISFSASLLLVLIRHIMEKISIAGGRRSALGFLIPDSVIGGLNGFLVFFVLLPLSPLLTTRWQSHSKSRLIKGLLAGGLVAGIASSFLFPYSLQHPKRIFLNHLCRQQSDGSCISVWSVAAWDVTSLDITLPDSLKAQTPIATDPLDWTSVTPFNRLVADMAFKGPPFPEEGPWGTYHPRLELIQQWHNAEEGSRTLEFALKWEKPGWGAMNITGPIRNWSLADPSGIQVLSLFSDPRQHRMHLFDAGGAKHHSFRPRCRRSDMVFLDRGGDEGGAGFGDWCVLSHAIGTGDLSGQAVPSVDDCGQRNIFCHSLFFSSSICNAHVTTRWSFCE